MKIFETFECSDLSNSFCQFWNNKLISLKILYPSSVSLKITPLFFFSLNTVYYAQKEHIKKNIIETFECLSQNFSDYSCQFWNDKSIPLQILHHSSLSWHITPLSILSSYFSYFELKGPIKIPILRLSSSLLKICHIPHVIFQTTSQFFLQILHHLSMSLKITPLYFSGQQLNTLHNRRKWKCKFWRLSSAWVKFHQVFIIFKTTDQIFFKFCINLQCHEI